MRPPLYLSGVVVDDSIVALWNTEAVSFKMCWHHSCKWFSSLHLNQAVVLDWTPSNYPTQVQLFFLTVTTPTWSRKHPKQQQFQGIAIGLMLYMMVPFSPWARWSQSWFSPPQQCRPRLVFTRHGRLCRIANCHYAHASRVCVFVCVCVGLWVRWALCAPTRTSHGQQIHCTYSKISPRIGLWTVSTVGVSRRSGQRRWERWFHTTDVSTLGLFSLDRYRCVHWSGTIACHLSRKRPPCIYHCGTHSSGWY